MKINKNNLSKVCILILFAMLGFISGYAFCKTYSQEPIVECQAIDVPAKLYMEMLFQDTITPGIYGINVNGQTLQIQLDTLQLWQNL